LTNFYKLHKRRIAFLFVLL